MTDSKTLHELFVEELSDSYDSEKQLTKALKKMASSAQDADLEDAFLGHLDETIGHIALLEEAFALLAIKPRGKHCDGIAGVIEEAKGELDEMSESAVRDASLIGGGRRAEHYEIAAYNALIAMGEELDYVDICALLRRILAEEEAADKKLTGLARTINAAARKESLSEV